ncbi:hypothetical protein ARALYDRAFT_331550 [Arabidopsis lyrata subsp. lyrata]|uniref:F-box domain-containing protein n=1 Tax=Arabidopsis lyrata subsp. lyrata TaxID=81972 RepID=D7MRI5_ARALL|nr:hypothetical protein ARALYDRAFT_331550 [Arabidopsis lyrata subsp. lyrata]
MKRRREATTPSPTRLRHREDINIPLDVTVEILKKLPTKSIVRFQFVSKQWSSVINMRRDFIDFIMKRSLAQPPRDAYFIASDDYREFLYNPTTRQSLYFLKKKTMHMETSFIGYDPLENQYKVLFLPKYNPEQPCLVFTLGETATKWKTIQGVESHHPLQGALCINGRIYYQAGIVDQYDSTSLYKLMSFDVRSEEFHNIEAPKTLMDYRSYLINYQGKLGFVCCEKGVDIWVMETQGWSKIFFKGSIKWRILDATHDGEIVLVRWGYLSYDRLCVLYYDPKRNTKRYVDFEGIFPKFPSGLFRIMLRTQCVCIR